jgi:uncharacterized protein (DUF58 family)
MSTIKPALSQLWAKADRPGIRAFFLSMLALGIALILALYSGAAAQLGNLFLASASALTALLVATWVGVTLVPVLAKRTPLRWIGYRMEYKITREGWFYIIGIVLVAMAAINTGNNLLFLILACLIASILMSGILSSVTLAGVEMRLELPERIFSGQTVRGSLELKNEKLTLPSFSLRVEAVRPKGSATAALLETPVYFPYLPRQQSLAQSVPLLFPNRGIYRQEAFRIVTRFPFGFLQKARRLDLPAEALVYPSVEAGPEFLDILPGIQGAMASVAKGHGQDLYSLRDYTPNDSARHVHWKASARSGSLMVREFSRDDDCRVLLVLDARNPAAMNTSGKDRETFERAVSLCAAIAWSFSEREAFLEFRSGTVSMPLLPASENIFAILRHLALVQPEGHASSHSLLSTLSTRSDSFRVIVTSQSRGAIPAEAWNTSYVVFAEDSAG